MGRVLRVGLSGGIGSGKSTVAKRLADLGAVVIDSDVLAREVVAPGSDGLAAVVERFGSDVLDADGALDRPAMARRVFGDDEARAALNAIVHPRVGARTAELMEQAAEDAIVVHDVPLLVELGYAPSYHLVVIVDAPVEDRVRRLVDRGLEESDARARIRAQATEDQRREAADVWLDNSGAVDDVHAAVDALWADRLVPFEANVRLRTRPPERSPVLVEPDPEWPRTARRLLARVERAAGDAVVRADHVGSTSVPDLPAKDVVDLQLTVRSMAAADGLAEPLARAGFPVVPEIRGDNPHPVAPAPGQWAKRVHVSADPGRYANLHVRVAGGPGWRYALLFRDWLRADDDAREEYLRIKREAAQRHASNPDAYTEAKEPWFADALPRAEEWASRTGWEPPAV
ncbi:dephospho-CoA kinase [Saccharopolyspora erythraea NRRL 2338]|uniref:Dephospho-CoA kinase n=1 Tax=Saccharopolyspora erythraea TaxID=1836 RepID=A0ABN1E557_SACER|nr:dephospho-CoA kinase [Saccharopolyspora erythraea D]PFG98302.1 dephospho-CoA kinase [Saccharopolyspora erythraea NRRL 2338]